MVHVDMNGRSRTAQGGRSVRNVAPQPFTELIMDAASDVASELAVGVALDADEEGGKNEDCNSY